MAALMVLSVIGCGSQIKSKIRKPAVKTTLKLMPKSPQTKNLQMNR